MNHNPHEVAVVRGLQGHSLGIKPHFLHRFHVTLLCLYSKFPMLENGGVTFNEALLNIFVATTFWLPQVHHFHALLEVDQVATS
jgi:hypothetical protein